MSDANASLGEENPNRKRFETLLRLLDPERERAGEKYEAIRRKLIKFFEWNFCSPAEDLADETLERLEQRVGEAEIHDVAGFAWGIAKNVRQESHRRAARTVPFSILRQGENPLPDPLDIEKDLQQKMQQERRQKCLRLCLQRLPARDREMFLAYHDADAMDPQARLAMAKQMGLTLGALRVRVNRLRDELERCSRQCFASWRTR